jgi:hypothetical protein
MHFTPNHGANHDIQRKSISLVNASGLDYLRLAIVQSKLRPHTLLVKIDSLADDLDFLADELSDGVFVNPGRVDTELFQGCAILVLARWSAGQVEIHTVFR